MDAAVERLGTQLGQWRLEIDNLAAKNQRPGVQPRFDALTHVDELKALHAIAQSRFDAYRAAGNAEQTRLKSEMKLAWDELESAFKKTRPPRTRRNAGSETDP